MIDVLSSCSTSRRRCSTYSTSRSRCGCVAPTSARGWAFRPCVRLLGVRRGRGQADGRGRDRQAAVRFSCTGARAPTTIASSRRPARADEPGEARPDRAAALRGILDKWLERHMRFERCRQGRVEFLEGWPAAEGDCSAGAWASCGRARAGARFTTLDAPPSQRREGGQLLVLLPRRRRPRSRSRARRATRIARSLTGVSIGATRLGDAAARPRVQVIVDVSGLGAARARRAGARRGRRRRRRVPARRRARSLRRRVAPPRHHRHPARPAGAVPVLIKHLPEVQNCSRDGRAGRHRLSGGRRGAVERLRRDEYVPVRIAAAKALAKLGDVRVAALVDEAARKEKEATIAAARAAASAARPIRSGRPPPPPTKYDQPAVADGTIPLTVGKGRCG